MASIKTLPRNRFEIVLDDNTVIVGQYGTWAYKNFCDKRGIKLSEIGKCLEQWSVSEDLSVLSDYILSAIAQSHYERSNDPMPYRDVHLFSWIDQLGGIGSENFTLLVNPGGISEDQKKSLPETP